jgi:hypothetical protein
MRSSTPLQRTRAPRGGCNENRSKGGIRIETCGDASGIKTAIANGGVGPLMPLACVASCTVWPAVTGDAGEPRDAAAEQRALEAESAPPEAPACAGDPECAAPTPYCVPGVCASTRALGSACTSPPECPSGHCVDGVCCIAAACPMCEACGVAGSCAPAATGTACTTSHASASGCDGQGSCGETQCDPGYLDCDGSPRDGCETAIGLSNCGGCGVLCSPEYVTVPLCSAGSAGCTYAACSPGYLDCDGDKTNGCETPISVANCGTCGSICQPGNAIGAVCSPPAGADTRRAHPSAQAEASTSTATATGPTAAKATPRPLPRAGPAGPSAGRLSHATRDRPARTRAFTSDLQHPRGSGVSSADDLVARPMRRRSKRIDGFGRSSQRGASPGSQAPGLRSCRRRSACRGSDLVRPSLRSRAARP